MIRLTLRRLTAIFAVVVGLAVANPARADIVIDNFAGPNPGVVFALDAPVGSTFNRTDGNRTLLVTQTQNSFGLPSSTNGIIGQTGVGGRFVLNTNTGTTAYASLSYSYASPLNLMAGGTILNFAFTSTDLNVPFSVTIGDGTSTSTQVGLVTSPTNLSFDLSSFGGVNLDSVSSIKFDLNLNTLTNASTTSADFSVANITITTPNVAAVPAPPAFALLLAAAPVVALRRWKAKKAA